jgi:hypothetical protein
LHVILRLEVIDAREVILLDVIETVIRHVRSPPEFFRRERDALSLSRQRPSRYASDEVSYTNTRRMG